MKLRDVLVVFAVVSLASVLSNALGTACGLLESLPGIGMLALIAFAGWSLARLVPVKLPAVVWTVVLGCALTCPGVPGSSFIASQVAKADFVALCTPILAYAGIAFGKDMKVFFATGWKTVALALIVFAGTYFGSALIAHGMLRLCGSR